MDASTVIVQKYQMLSREEDIAICTCADVRSIYDDLVLDEVARDNPDHVPDGTLFRKGPVSVCDATRYPHSQGNGARIEDHSLP